MRRLESVPFVMGSILLAVLAGCYLAWAFSQMRGPVRASEPLLEVQTHERVTSSEVPHAPPGPVPDLLDTESGDRIDAGSFKSSHQKMSLIQRVPFGADYGAIEQSLPGLSSLRGGSAGTSGVAFLDTEVFGFPFNIQFTFGDGELLRMTYWYGPLEVGDQSPEVFNVLRDYLLSQYGSPIDADPTDMEPNTVKRSRWEGATSEVVLEFSSYHDLNIVSVSFAPPSP